HRTPVGPIRRREQTGGPVAEAKRFLLIPRMSVERHRVGAGVDELMIDRLRDSKTARRVLTVDDHEVELPVAYQGGQALIDNAAAAAAHDIADEKNSHPSISQIDDFAFR